MRSLVAVALVALSVPASAQDPRGKASAVDAAIDRGLAFLARDATAWKEEHNCVSCHHAALEAWSMWEARSRGHDVDEAVLAEMTRWVAESGSGKTGVPRPADRPKAFNAKAVWFALALGTDFEPDAASKAGLKLLLETVKEDQTEAGSWVAWPETRPPIFGDSDESMTALATLAVLPAAAGGDAAAKAVLDKGVQWLAEKETDDDPQSIAMRLVLWTRLERPPEEWRPLVRRIEGRQNADGGWSQAEGMASDAWATGQALYALAHAGVKPDEPVFTRAHAFLVGTQREDGSWPMTSRPVEPGGEGAKSLIPITGAGSAWAVLGLVRSRGPAPESSDEAAVRAVVQKYVDAREAKAPAAIEALFTEDADQLVSDGTWRKGRDELVSGMLESSRRNPARRTIEVTSVRFLSPDVSLVDGRYVQKAAEGDEDRVMWTAITLKRGPVGWRIAAIRNMLPASPPPG